MLLPAELKSLPPARPGRVLTGLLGDRHQTWLISVAPNRLQGSKAGLEPIQACVNLLPVPGPAGSLLTGSIICSDLSISLREGHVGAQGSGSPGSPQSC